MVFVKKWRFFNPYFLCKMDQQIVFFKGSERKESFLDQTNIGSKNHQNLHFFKGVSPWFLSKNGNFLILTFYAKRNKKQCFLKVQKEKKPFQSKKTAAQKTTKICIFPKGLVHGFCLKNGDFLIFSFYAKWIKKQCFLKVPKEKKPFQTRKNRLKKPPKFAFFQRDQSMVFVKKWIFFNLQFLCKMDQGKEFFIGFERKEAFLEQRTSAQKTTKIGIF